MRTLAILTTGEFTSAAQTEITLRITLPEGMTALSITINGEAVPLSALQDGLLTSTRSLTEGANTFTVVLTDSQGHRYTATTRITRVTAGPGLTVTSPAANATTTARTLDVVGTYLRTVTITGQPAFVSGGAFSARAFPLGDGANLLTIVATDEAGNSATVTRIVTAHFAATDPAPVTLSARY